MTLVSRHLYSLDVDSIKKKCDARLCNNSVKPGILAAFSNRKQSIVETGIYICVYLIYMPMCVPHVSRPIYLCVPYILHLGLCIYVSLACSRMCACRLCVGLCQCVPV